MIVRELMSAPVVTIDADATLRDAVDQFLEYDVGCVVAAEAEGPEHDGTSPIGILTATDVHRATFERGEPLSAIHVRSAASRPLVTVEPDRTVGHAVDRMAEADVRHLPVVDDLDVVGIVTVTDVAVAYDEGRDEAMELIGGRRGTPAGDTRPRQR